MMITKRSEVFFRIEMTEQQATDLHMFLNTGINGHCNELAVQETFGKVSGDAVHEVLNNLREALENR